MQLTKVAATASLMVAVINASPTFLTKDYHDRTNTTHMRLLRDASGPPRHMTRVYDETTCNAGQVKLINFAWDKAAQFAEALHERRGARIDYDRISRGWFGSKWNDQGDASHPELIPNYKKRIENNIRNVANKVYGTQAPGNERILFYCFHPDCNKAPLPNAFTSDTRKDGMINHYIWLCPRWFNLPMLGKQVQSVKEAIVTRRRPDSYAWEMMNYFPNKEITLFHETLHFSTVGDPLIIDLRPEDEVSWRGPGGAWDLARIKGTSKATINVDNYALAGLAAHLAYSELRSSIPPEPKDYVRTGTSKAKSANTEAIADFEPPLLPAKLDPAVYKPMPDETNCYGVTAINWISHSALNNFIPQFCAVAEVQGSQDKDSGGITRQYASGDDAVELSISWNGPSWKPTKAICIDTMNTIMNNCDGNDPSNPMNAKRGGKQDVDIARYAIKPLNTRYATGQCTMHVKETESWFGNDGWGEARQWTHKVAVDVYDGNGEYIAGSGGDKEAKDGKPYVFNALYAPLYLTPEAQGGDYIQFSIGADSWTTAKPGANAGCTVGGWSDRFSGHTRDMDCHFLC